MKRLASGIVGYLKGVKEEFAKVAFPSRKEVVAHTAMVIVSILVAVVVIGAIDTGLAQVVKFVFINP